MTAGTPHCALCGAELTTGLIATGSRQCCLNATPIVGACPEHGPLGPHNVTDAEAANETPADDPAEPTD